MRERRANIQHAFKLSADNCWACCFCVYCTCIISLLLSLSGCWMKTLSAMPSVSFLHAFLALCNCPQIGTLWPPVRLTANVTHSLLFCCITQLFLNVLSVLLGHWLTENLSNPGDASLRFRKPKVFGSWSKYPRWRKTVFKYLPEAWWMPPSPLPPSYFWVVSWISHWKTCEG